MNAMNEMLQQPVPQAIGWALLQFIWQGTLIAALTAALLTALRRSAADVRYVVATIGLVLMLTMPVVTTVQSMRSAPPPAAPAAMTPGEPGQSRPNVALVLRGADDLAIATAAPAAPAIPRVPMEQWLPVCVALWLAGVALLTLRLLSAWMWVQRLKSRGAIVAGDSIQQIAARLTRRLHITRTVRLLESPAVDVPTVIGWIKPVVLLPASVLAGLTPQQLEAILAHELAHVRRHDYLVNLLQTAVETLLFYHPAVWWLSHRIRVERENCCDDLAVSLCGDPVTYAAALAELEGLRGGDGHLILAASGGSLLQRVRRLLGAPTHAGRAPGWLAAAVALIVIVGICAGAASHDGLRAQAFAAVIETDDDQFVPPPPPAPEPPQLPEPVTAAEPPAEPVSRAARPATTRHLRTLAHPVEELTRALSAVLALVSTAGPVEPARPVVVRELAPATPAVAPTVRAVPDAAAPVVTTSVATTPAAATPAVAAAAVDAAYAEAHRAVTASSGIHAAAPRHAAQAQSAAIETIHSSDRDGQKSGNYVWSNDGRKFEVSYRGDIEFTDDDVDVRSMTPGGWLRIKDSQRGGAEYRVEFNAGSGGAIERRFWVGAAERPFETDGRKWLKETLPRFIRQSGIGAANRVARIYQSRGADGVLAEVSLIEGGWAKRLYLTHLLKTPGLGPHVVQHAIAQAGREIDSDYELASLLISAGSQVTDEPARKAYFDAARTIDSDYEMRRVFSSALERGPVSSNLFTGLLETSASIGSDYELASLLEQAVRRQPIDNAARAAFFRALQTIESAYERRRVLTAAFQRSDLPADVAAPALDAVSTMRSDYEAATVLLHFVKDHQVEGAVRAPFFRAVSNISSPYERGRVLQAAARRGDASNDTIVEIIRATAAMRSGYEKAQVLLAIAGAHQLTRDGRDAYIDASRNLADHEQGRVLSALARNERR